LGDEHVNDTAVAPLVIPKSEALHVPPTVRVAGARHSRPILLAPLVIPKAGALKVSLQIKEVPLVIRLVFPADVFKIKPEELAVVNKTLFPEVCISGVTVVPLPVKTTSDVTTKSVVKPTGVIVTDFGT
jgi:hypothetical protein